MRARITPLRVLGVLAGLCALTLVVLYTTPSGSLPGMTSQYILLPDVAHPVAPLVKVQGAQPAHGGTVYFVDVVERRASSLEALFPSLRPHATLVPTSDLVPPGTTSAAMIAAEQRQMSMSQRIAAAVALRRLGYHVVIHRDGVLVNAVELDTDAASKLQAADIIASVGGQRTPTVARLHARLDRVKPGRVVSLGVLRGSRHLTLHVRTFSVSQVPGHAFIGIDVAQAATITLPIRVSIDAHGIGGPSAGLAFALEVMEKLGHDVTHGHRVAATGQMNLDGTVSPIGGVKQKTWGVRQAGADVFLVPVGADNVRDARRNAGHSLRIIPVHSFAQALHALATLPPAQ